PVRRPATIFSAASAQSTRIDSSGTILPQQFSRRNDAEIIVGRGCSQGAGRQAGAPFSRSEAVMGKDERAADARSSSGLDADGEGGACDGAKKSGASFSAAQATRDLLASISQGSADSSRADHPEAVGMDGRARRGASACSVIRDFQSRGV